MFNTYDEAGRSEMSAGLDAWVAAGWSVVSVTGVSSGFNVVVVFSTGG